MSPEPMSEEQSDMTEHGARSTPLDVALMSEMSAGPSGESDVSQSQETEEEEVRVTYITITKCT